MSEPNETPFDGLDELKPLSAFQSPDMPAQLRAMFQGMMEMREQTKQEFEAERASYEYAAICGDAASLAAQLNQKFVEGWEIRSGLPLDLEGVFVLERDKRQPAKRAEAEAVFVEPMTYMQIDKAQFEYLSISDLPLNTQTAWEVMEFFRGRKGFESAWWHDIDNEVKDEIFAGLRDLLAVRFGDPVGVGQSDAA
jgi:hypothetical protein